MARIPINEVYSSPSMARMARIPINEVYFVSKHVKNSNQRGVLRLHERERNDVVRRVSGVDGKECEEIGV